MKIDRELVPQQARFWGKHCCINALPSFIIALFYLQLWQQPLAVFAMLMAIACFVVGYTLVTSIEGWFSEEDSLLSRSMRIGVKVRMVISLLSLLLLFPSPALFIVPDVWAGMLAASLVNAASGFLFGAPAAADFIEGGMHPLGVFATTVLEGLILSFALLMICFFTLLILQMRARKRIPEVVVPPEVES